MKEKRGDKTKEILVVLKAIELRNENLSKNLSQADTDADKLIDSIRYENSQWGEILSEIDVCIDLSTPSQKLINNHTPLQKNDGNDSHTYDWEKLLEESRTKLDQEGINADDLKLAETAELTKIDVAVAFSIGILSAWIPSIKFGENGSLVDIFDKIEEWADNHKFRDSIQQIFGEGSPASFMDDGASGTYHRFKDGHDLINAIPEGIKHHGFVNGILQVFQHLLRDSFGKTGIPLPGSTSLGDTIAKSIGQEGGITNLIKPRDLSRYAGLRMTDIAASGSTSLMLWGYRTFKKYESDSIQAHKLSIISHGVCFFAVAAMTSLGVMPLQNASGRSFLNHVSLVAMLKSSMQLHIANRKLKKEIDKMDSEIEKMLDGLELSSSESFAADFDNALQSLSKDLG